MITESFQLKDQCRWFTSLVSNKANLADLIDLLQMHKDIDCRTIQMKHGHKVSHILAWSFR
jgi:23S rRNA (adenine1618-N6)-methyltransferase